MNGCTDKLAKVLDEPIRPGVVIQLADKANKISTNGATILASVTLNNVNFLYSNSNGNDGTVNADFCGYGYKVDDPMYRCGSGNLGGNGGVADRFFTSVDMTPNVEFSHGLMFVSYNALADFNSLALEIAPLYSGTLTMELETYQGVSLLTKSISDTQKIERVTFDLTGVQLDGSPLYMNFTLSRGGRFAFTGTYANDSFEDLLFNNSNIVKVETYINTDLYSQAIPNDQIEVTILDINHEYDPANPQGKFAKLTPDREFFLRLGYRLPDRQGVVEWVSGAWGSGAGYHISDKPTYQDQKVTMLMEAWKLGEKTNVSVPIQTGLYGVGNEVASRNLTIFSTYPYVNTTALIDKQDYMSADMWAQNAQGRYYRHSGTFTTVANINSLTVRDYVINDNRILDGGVQLDKQPLLKNLIVKQYKNVQSALRLTQSFSVAAADYEYYSAWGLYRARIYNSQELDISCIEMTHTGGVDWRIIYEDVNNSGVLSTSIYVTASSKVVVSGSFNIYGTDSSSTDIVLKVNDEGEDMTIDNPLITSNALVVSCADATKIVAAMREVYKVNMVNDIRLQNADCVYLDTPYEKNIPVIITGIKRVMPGIKSEITCRRLNV